MRKSDLLALQAVAGKRVGPTGWMRGNCPWCEHRVGKADRRGCLGVNAVTGKVKCQRCGYGSYVVRMPDDVAEAVRHLAAAPEARQVAKAMEPPEGYWPLFEGDGARSMSLDAPRRYLTAPPPPPGTRKGPEHGRGLDVGVLRAAKVGACLKGPFAGRVVVPVLGDDGDGREVWFGWSSRPWVHDPEVSYRYPPGMALSELVYHHAALLVETDEPVLVVEGVFDTHALWPDASATLGGIKEGHFPAMVAARRPVVQVPDGDAWEKGWIFTMRLRFEGQRAGAVRLPPRVDPDEVPLAELREAARESLTCDVVRL